LLVSAALAGTAKWGPARPAHIVAGAVASLLVVAAIVGWWRGRHRERSRRRRWVRALLAVPLAVFVVLPLAAETFVLATDGPAHASPDGLEGAFVRTGNVNTHYEQWGTAGAPLVLVPGFLESTSVWSTSAPLLAVSHRVFAYDVRGFGYTERRGPFTLDGDVTQLDAFLMALSLDAGHGALPVLVGHSSGAAIITAFARLHPERVAGIVLVDGDATPYGAGPEWAHNVVVEPLFTAGLRLALRNDSLVRAVLRRQCGQSCDIDPVQWQEPMRQAGAEDALLRILRQRIIGLEPAQIEQVQVPAAVLSGEFDSTMGPDQVRTTANRLHTELATVLTGEHHLPMLHDPAGFVAALDASLSGLASTARRP
ncbi:MAG: hypothetical protein JWM93_3560, partial [Frankiales bacterium]|nr:hypothetical protein [Frankiales bacterium]